MGSRTALRRPIVALLFVVGTTALASPASATTSQAIAPSDPHAPSKESGWQAGTCNAEPPEAGAETCSVETPSQFFEEAAAHPQYGFTQFIVAHNSSKEPNGELKDVHVDLPVGLSVNPQATEQCPLATFKTGDSFCPAGSQVGTSHVFGTVPVLGTPLELEAGVYNVEPEEGQPALFGLELAGNEVFLKASIEWEGNYHEGFSIEVPPLIHLKPLFEGLILKNRLVFKGRSGDGTFITTPTTCLGEAFTQSGSVYSTDLLAALAQEETSGYEFPADAEPPLESPIPPGTSPKHCTTIPYEPTISVDPGTTETDSPAGSRLDVSVPHITGGATQDSSDTKEATVTLPAGMGINPSAANGLEVCTDEQFGKGTRNPVECPAGSKVGTVEIETPPLPEHSLEGDVFVGKQLSRDPASGNEYRIFVDAESERYGISVRLIGKVSANPQTGQLTTTFQETPQVPFTSFVIHLDGGPKATLTSPPTCGPNGSGARLTPWSATIGAIAPGGEEGPSEAPPATPSSEFTLTSLPGGAASPCPKTLAARPFAPKFSAQSSSTKAGAYTELGIDIAREPGSQELKAADISLPPGMTAKLAGVRYCPEEAISAAAANSGAAEAAAPSCPPESLVGSAAVTLGSGTEPLHIESGRAYLAGPYKGAPLSLVVVTPGTAGPFDLGTVVVRVALQLDPKTARVTTVTDPLPHVYGGSILDVRDVKVKINRPQFSLNGTNCSPFAFEGALRGGGADPNNPASFSTVPISSPYQLSGCENLGFKPKLTLRTFGGLRRTKKPKLRATLVTRPGDANLSRAQVALPKALILEQANIGNVCTRVQFAANECPADSVYGFAEATTPLLDGPLKGPVYLRSNPEHELPDFVAALHGQVDVEVSGVTDTTKGGRLRNTFEMVPDVPVSKFTLTVRGGKRGLLVSTRNLCKHKLFSRVELNGQNGDKVLKKKLRVGTSCKRHKAHKRHRHGKRAD